MWYISVFIYLDYLIIIVPKLLTDYRTVSNPSIKIIKLTRVALRALRFFGANCPFLKAKIVIYLNDCIWLQNAIVIIIRLTIKTKNINSL